MKHSIQIDMFEVQLGAALLLQFNTPDGIVSVLADAGVGRGYPEDHVHEKLSDILSRDSRGLRRIDLVIGTHYDADHLKGMVRIIVDESIEIGEASLPPVANDAESQDPNLNALDPRYLADQLMGPNGRQVLGQYLQFKAKNITSISDPPKVKAQMEGGLALPRVFQWAVTNTDPGSAEQFQASAAQPRELSSTEDEDDIRVEAIDWFDRKLALPEEDSKVGHADTFIEGLLTVDDLASVDIRQFQAESNPETKRDANDHVRRSEARDAINATSLARVVSALKSRDIPIRCINIEDGIPLRLVWSPATSRFEAVGSSYSPSSISLVLLGPSKSLVRKHWERLPVGSYTATAIKRKIPIRQITPCNQLSYVATFGFEGQRILISGDAGCVDFRRQRQDPYFEALISCMRDLNVIQVAHHAGHNAHFYTVLEEAGIESQAAPIYFLLSHEVDDKHRPSGEFASFMAHLQGRSDVKLLFTSRPQAEKVGNYRDRIYGVTDAPADRGDVRLAFDPQGWSVQQHAVLLEEEAGLGVLRCLVRSRAIGVSRLARPSPERFAVR